MAGRGTRLRAEEQGARRRQPWEGRVVGRKEEERQGAARAEGGAELE
jgi:hypothetical protein